MRIIGGGAAVLVAVVVLAGCSHAANAPTPTATPPTTSQEEPQQDGVRLFAYLLATTSTDQDTSGLVADAHAVCDAFSAGAPVTDIRGMRDPLLTEADWDTVIAAAALAYCPAYQGVAGPIPPLPYPSTTN